MKHILLSFLIILFSSSIQGQGNIEANIRTTDITFEKDGNNQLTIQAVVCLEQNLKLDTNRGATLTPVLRSGNNVQTLAPIIVYGRKRAILSKRNDRIPAHAYTIIHRKRNTNQEIKYLTTIPYQTWMENANFYLLEDFCGCGNATEENREVLLATVPSFTAKTSEHPITDVSVREQKQPEPAESTPPADFIKKSIEGRADLCFPLNEIVIYPDYLNNPAELLKICSSIEKIAPEKILRIYLHGYASPEGSRSNNLRLAQGRVEALKKQLIEQYHFADSTITTQFTAEDWGGFRQQIVASDLQEKQAILNIIDSKEHDDGKEIQLKQLGVAYKQILKDYFPYLRHTDYKIEYMESVEPKSSIRR